MIDLKIYKRNFILQDKTMARYLTQRVIINLLLQPQHQLQLQLLKPALLHMRKCLTFTKFALQKRLSHNSKDILDHTCEISNYDDYQKIYQPVLRIMVQTLKELLNVTTYQANKIITDNPHLKKKSRANILENYYNLFEAGIQKSTIVKNSWLLAHDSNKLKNKLHSISVLKMDNDQLVPWLRLTQDELTNYVHQTECDTNSYTRYNKIEYLAHRLECTIQQLCEITVQYSFLLKTPVSSIEKKLNILNEYDISNKHILKDLWVLRYSENHIRHRCELYKDAGNLEIKTWAIRCPLRVIARAIEKNHIKHNFLRNHETVNEYLMRKLKIDETTLNLALTKWPKILRINLTKLDRLISILHHNGITSDEILQYERIFYFNVETVQNRLEMFKKEGLTPKIPALIWSEQQFQQFVKKKIAERDLLGPHKNVRDFLISKLNADENSLDKAIIKAPLLLRVNVHQLNEVIHMLQENGITNDKILCYPRIFHHNKESLRQRLEILREAGIPPRINLLIFGQKYFDRCVNFHKRKNKKK
nr:PREDICTED: uncharacterized protein LOC105674401 [Linepithema humile]